MRLMCPPLLFLAFLFFSISFSTAETELTVLRGTSNIATQLLRESSDISQRSSRFSTTCSHPSCTRCDSCDFDNLKAELFQCKRAIDALKLKLSQNISPLEIARECSFEKCFPGQREKYCGVIKHQPGSDIVKELDSALRLRKAELASLKAKIAKIKAPHQRSGLLEYGRKMEEAREVMAKQRTDVLKARAYNAELEKYMESFEHRKVMHEVARYQSENSDLYEQLKFWEAQNQTLASVVRLSPGAVQKARDDLHAKMQEFEADAQLLDVMRRSSYTKEEQVKLVGELKTELRYRLDHARTVNAHAKREAVFIAKAGKEIYNLLENSMKKMKQGKVRVDCGATALSKSVHNELSS